MKKILFILILLCLLPIANLNADTTGFSITENQVKASGTIVDGVTYKNYSATLNNDLGSTTSQNVSYVKRDANAYNVRAIVWSKVQGGSSFATLENIAKDYESLHPGEKVLAGINADYFSTSSTINAHMQDGDIINSSNHSKYSSIAISDDSKSFYQSKTVELEQNYCLSIYDSTKTRIVKQIVLGSQNTIPNDIYKTTIYYRSTYGYVLQNTRIFNVNLESSTSRGSIAVYTGAVEEEVVYTPLDTTVFAIATKDQEIATLLSNMPYIKVSKFFKSGNNSYMNLVGVGSRPLTNNKILEFTEIGDQSEDFCKARHPRSSIGWTANGDMILATIDGRQASDGMQGVNLREEAYIMQQLGCVDAFNLDGGGSTQLLMRNSSDEFIYLNSRSEVRSVANAILFVQSPVGIALEVTVRDDLMSFTYQVKNSENVSIENVNIYFDNVLLETPSKIFDVNKPHYLSFEISYQENGISQKYTYNRRIVANGFEGICVQEEVIDQEPTPTDPTDATTNSSTATDTISSNETSSSQTSSLPTKDDTSNKKGLIIILSSLGGIGIVSLVLALILKIRKKKLL